MNIEKDERRDAKKTGTASWQLYELVILDSAVCSMGIIVERSFFRNLSQ